MNRSPALLAASALLASSTAVAGPPPFAPQCGAFQGQAYGQCVAWFANGCDVDASKPSCTNLTNPFPEVLLVSVSDVFGGYSLMPADASLDYVFPTNGVQVPWLECDEIGNEITWTGTGVVTVDETNDADFASAASCLSGSTYLWRLYRSSTGSSSRYGNLIPPELQGATITSVDIEVVGFSAERDEDACVIFGGALACRVYTAFDVTWHFYGTPAP